MMIRLGLNGNMWTPPEERATNPGTTDLLTLFHDGEDIVAVLDKGPLGSLAKQSFRRYEALAGTNAVDPFPLRHSLAFHKRPYRD